MEFKEARSHVVVEYRGRVCHADACSQGGDLAEEFYERDLRRKNRSLSHVTIKELLHWQKTINSMQGRSTLIYDIISFMRWLKMEKSK